MFWKQGFFEVNEIIAVVGEWTSAFFLTSVRDDKNKDPNPH